MKFHVLHLGNTLSTGNILPFDVGAGEMEGDKKNRTEVSHWNVCEKNNIHRKQTDKSLTSAWGICDGRSYPSVLNWKPAVQACGMNEKQSDKWEALQLSFY